MLSLLQYRSSKILNFISHTRSSPFSSLPVVSSVVQTSKLTPIMGSVGVEEKELPSHYKDWPNAQGFDTSFEERIPIELEVTGQIPSYAAGILFRTGLGPRTVETNNKGTFKVNHWFDNFAQVHRFQIHAPKEENEKVRVTYNSRLVSDGLMEKVRKQGNLTGYTFAAKYDPCKSFFQKLQSFFISPPPPKPNEVNIGVTMSVNFPGVSADGKPSSEHGNSSEINTLCNKTDAPQMQMINPETLEPIGIASQESLHPDLKGACSAAHAKSDPITGDVFNFNLEFGKVGTWRLFRVSASTGKTSILATVKHTPAYLHSLFLTENHVILCVWNSYFRAGGAAILWTKNLLDAMTYDSTAPAKWFVIDKRPQEEGGQGLLATFDSDPFFAFHSVNAYEEISADGKTDIIADIPVYSSIEVLNKFYLENILSDSPKAKEYMGKWGSELAPQLRRYRLADIPSVPRTDTGRAEVLFEAQRHETPELPTVNWSYVTKKHRYIYGIADSGKSTFADSLVKFDTQTQTSIRWYVHGQTAGEAVFVADPNSTDEDGGVLLTVVLDGVEGKSYLLALDAHDLSEMGRANVDGIIGFAFHGLHTKQGLPSGSTISSHL